MLICAECLNDEEMQKAILYDPSSKIGACDASGLTDKKVVNIDIFEDFFDAFLSVFIPDPKGSEIVGLIQKDWNLFATNEIGKKVITYFLNSGRYHFSITDLVGYNDDVKNIASKWDNLKQDVQSKKRFFADLSDFESLGIIKDNSKILKDQQFYRARVLPAGKTILATGEMGCPPPKLASPGRANPLGIPYLYLCQDEATTYYEVRALYLDKLCIGTFRIKEDCAILDFTSTYSSSLYFAYNADAEPLSSVLGKQKLFQLISHDLSKPLRRYDTEIEYVPTQLICEYCKINNIDGIKFYSSLHKGGINVVLFYPEKAECTAVNVKEILNVSISDKATI